MDHSQDSGYPLGMRNNNPGDIRDSGIAWKGMTGSNEGFCVFSDSTYGLRALALDLTTKINSDGLDTITDIISEYAPPSENDTASYISNVATYTGWGADDPIIYNANNLALLMRAIINKEVGATYNNMIPDADIETALGMLPAPLLATVGSFITSNPELQQSAGIGVFAFVVVAIILIFKNRKSIWTTLRTR